MKKHNLLKHHNQLYAVYVGDKNTIHSLKAAGHSFIWSDCHPVQPHYFDEQLPLASQYMV
jgi:outer membrane protease